MTNINKNYKKLNMNKKPLLEIIYINTLYISKLYIQTNQNWNKKLIKMTKTQNKITKMFAKIEYTFYISK